MGRISVAAPHRIPTSAARPYVISRRASQSATIQTIANTPTENSVSLTM